MRAWRHLLGGLILWAAHFFAVYAIASVLPGSATAPLMVVLVTVVALGVAGGLLAKSIRTVRSSVDDLQRWSAGVASFGYALALAAITYQGLPAILG